jgi:phage host-nuclease inhibitor protein Gam
MLQTAADNVVAMNDIATLHDTLSSMSDNMTKLATATADPLNSRVEQLTAHLTALKHELRSCYSSYAVACCDPETSADIENAKKTAAISSGTFDSGINR